jgi:hypothetical protein
VTDHLCLQFETGVMQLKLSEHRGDDADQAPQTSELADRAMKLTTRDHSPHDLNLSVSPSGASPRTHHERPGLERRGVLVGLEVEPSVGSAAERSEAQKVSHVAISNSPILFA